MLKKIRIKNFLSCQDTEIELDGVTALIGRNAAGKTNILRTIQLVAEFAAGNTSIADCRIRMMLRPKMECGIEFFIDENNFKYEFTPSNFIVGDLKESLWYYINNEWKLLAERDKTVAKQYYGDDVVDFEISNNASLIASILYFIPKTKLNPLIKKIANKFATINYYTLNEGLSGNTDNMLSGFVSNLQYKQWCSENGVDKSLVEMRLIDLWLADKETFDELNALIGKNGLTLINNIEIFEIDVTRDELDFLYRIRFYVADVIVNYTQLSYGTQRVLILLLALLYDKNSTLLIEQPEDSIHSGLLKKLLPLCFEYAHVYNKQIIIATHSPDIINLLPPENVRLVKMTEQGTKVSPLDNERIDFIHDYIKNEGALFDLIESMDDE